MLPEDESYQRRLEGRGPLLTAARLRYRALCQMTRSFTWRRQLKRNAAVLTETARTQDAVDEALEVVERRASSEGWNSKSETVRCAREVRQLREKLHRAVIRRVGKNAPLTSALRQLEEIATLGPRRVMPGERMATAIEVLPESLPEVQTLAAFGARLEAVFSRPLQPGERLPFTAEELLSLERMWADGEAALHAAWQRLQRVDLTGSVARIMRKRSSRAPIRQPRTGPEKLLKTEFWLTLAMARLREVVAQRVAPVTATDAELFHVVRWLCARERDETVRLQPADLMSDARAGVFELAYELAAVPARDQRDARVWHRLLERAARAESDLANEDDDTRRLKDNVRLLLRVLSKEARRPLEPPTRRNEVREPATFSSLVNAMRAQTLA